MRNRTKLFIIGFCVMAFLGGLITTQTAEAKTTYLVFSTGNIGGTYYPIGSGIASYISKKVAGIKIAAQASGGSRENINLVNSDQADLGLVPSAPGYKAYRGQKPFKKVNNHMMGIGMLHKSTGCFYALTKSGLKTVNDIKGKKVNLGTMGSARPIVAKAILKASGISVSDFSPTYLPFRDAVEAVKDGRIDASFTMAGLPAAEILDLSAAHKVTILAHVPGGVDNLVKMDPYFLKDVIPAGTYPKIDQDIPTFGEGTLCVCRPGLEEEVVYKITKAIYSKECLAYLGKIHAAAKGISLKAGLTGMTMKLHPGAAKFWKEAGLYDEWEAKKLYK